MAYFCQRGLEIQLDKDCYENEDFSSQIMEMEDICHFRQAKLDIGQCVTIAEHLTEGKYSPEEKE